MLIFENATAVALEPASVTEHCDIVCANGSIVELGLGVANGAPERHGAKGEVTRIDADERIVMPGLVCGHNHLYSGLSRGISVPLGPMPDFAHILENLWWRLDRSLTEDAIRVSAAVGILEAAASGTTTIIDHHASAGSVRGSLGILAGELERVGVRGLLCYETSDRDGPEIKNAALAENEAFAERAAEAAAEARENGRPAPLLAAAIGGHALFTLSEETLAEIASLTGRTGLGLHMHLGEDPIDREHAIEHHGMELTDRLLEHGLLDQNSILVHGLHVSDRDREAINKADAFLAHNTRSNMNNNVGYNQHLHELENWALGTDGIGSDMFTESRFAFFKHRDAGGPLGLDGIAAGLSGAQRLASRHFGATIGTLAPGAACDLVMLDYRWPTPLLPENLAGHLVFGMQRADVNTVVVDGKVIYENRAFPFDVEPIYEESRRVASELWKRMSR